MRLPDHPRDRFRVWAAVTAVAACLLTPPATLIAALLLDPAFPQAGKFWGAAFWGGLTMAASAAALAPVSGSRRAAGFMVLSAASFILTLAGQALAARL